MKLVKLYSLIIWMFVISGCATQFSNTDLINELSTQGLRAEETNRGVLISLPDEVFFEFGKSDLTAIAEREISRIVSVINDPRSANRKVVVEGHTDSIGDADANLELSKIRASVVNNSLVSSGVMTERISATGYGEKYPIAPNENADGSDNSEGRARNRRVEIILENLVSEDN